MKRAMTTMNGWKLQTARGVMAALLVASLAGCVRVTAPEKPIEIVLTINIRQEIVYRLDRDAKELIEQNTEIF